MTMRTVKIDDALRPVAPNRDDIHDVATVIGRVDKMDALIRESASMPVSDQAENTPRERSTIRPRAQVGEPPITIEVCLDEVVAAPFPAPENQDLGTTVVTRKVVRAPSSAALLWLPIVLLPVTAAVVAWWVIVAL